MTQEQRTQLGELVRRYRTKRGLSVREVAEPLGINPGALAQIESGRVQQPSFERLQALADVLDAPADELFMAAGYEPSALPELGAYFRAKYGLGNDAVDDIERYVRRIQKRYGDGK
ncbi:MAG: helix-turn-helix transcriptional regulator [Solirubrobacteraceae bacterium]